MEKNKRNHDEIMEIKKAGTTILSETNSIKST